MYFVFDKKETVNPEFYICARINILIVQNLVRPAIADIYTCLAGLYFFIFHTIYIGWIYEKKI